MTVRGWKYQDILAISELERECFKEPWSFRTLASTFASPAFFGLTAEDGGEIAGYGGITVAADSADIENIAVAEQYRRAGVGTSLMRGLEDIARKQGVKKIFLEVRVSNFAAMKMYLNLGYAGVYARTRYYADGEDCLVMAKEL